jgi:predicted dienelactone hydrolase
MNDTPTILGVLALAFLVGCPTADSTATDDDSGGQPDDDDEPPWAAPDERGSYEAGFVTLVHTDSRGKELTADVWYPATPAPGDEPDSYWPDLSFVFEGYRDAPPDPHGAPYPLVAFSHGYGGIRYQSPFLTEHLARHGFVVVSVDHTGNTFMDLDSSQAARVLAERPGDVRRAVDHLIEVSAGDHAQLAGMVDGSRYGMTGHSFGAVTTLILGGGELDIDHAITWCETEDAYACMYVGTLGDVSFDDALPDERIVSVAPMAPGAWYLFGEQGSGLADVTLPQVLAGDADAELDYLEEIRPCWEAIDAPKQLATLSDAGHWGFSDLCQIVPVFEECYGEGWMDVDQVHAITRPLITAHFGLTLAGDERYRPWLEPDYLDTLGGLSWESEDAP